MLKLTREEIARLEIGHTEISPLLSWTMVALFLGTLVAIPTVQLFAELQRGSEAGMASSVPSCAGIFCQLPGVVDVFVGSEGNTIDKVAASNAHLLMKIHEYEDQLEEQSWLAERILSPTQMLLTRWGGVGNEKAYVGHDGWLFYRPGIDYLIGPGFLDPNVLAKRAAAGNEYLEPHRPDPREAILDFHRQLSEYGILLIVMPTPVKPMLEPEQFTLSAAGQQQVLQNASYQQFKENLEEQGVLVADPAPALLARKQETGEPQYLQTDTHWAPEAMEFVAVYLKEFIAEHAGLQPCAAAGYRQRAAEVRNLGDIAVMMKLPQNQALYPRQSVTVHQVVRPDGELWTPETSADILLLGDSFTNIYSLAGMQWGESAGLAEQLSFQMQRPIDRIAQNDAGAFATRQALAMELARGNNRLAGKKVVIWQFAIRELAVGDWKKIPLKHRKTSASERMPRSTPAVPENGASNEPPSAVEGSQTAPHPGNAIPLDVVRGRIVEIAGVPKPGSVPYRDAVTAIHLSEVTSANGSPLDRDLVIYTWGMRENEWTAAARLQPGQQVQFALTPWGEVQDRYGRLTRLELDDPDFVLIDLPTYWAEEVPSK